MGNNNFDKQQQHYVPRALLSLYASEAEENRLFVFDKHAGRQLPGPMTVEKICKERGFYNAQAPHGKVSLEDAFQPLEQEYAKIAPKVIRDKSLASLAEAEFGALIAFVCAQFLRVPRIRAAFEQISEIIADKARAIAPEASNLRDFEELLDDNELRLRHLEAIVHGVVNFTQILAEYAWFVMEADEQPALWLSDCPVVLHNDEKSIYAGLGLAAPGVQIYLPMTPRLLLVCWHPVVAGRFIEKHKTSHELLGRLKAQYLLGMRNDKKRLKATIAELEKTSKPIDGIVSAIKSRGSVNATADNVLHFNWLQFQWSYRFVLCGRDDFSWAFRMLNEHPNLKTGMRIGG